MVPTIFIVSIEVSQNLNLNLSLYVKFLSILNAFNRDHLSSFMIVGLCDLPKAPVTYNSNNLVLVRDMVIRDQLIICVFVVVPMVLQLWVCRQLCGGMSEEIDLPEV